MQESIIKSADGGVRMSRIVLGAGSFGSEVNKDLSFEMMDRYYEAGGRTIDTGRIYMAWVRNGASKSEKTVGQWLNTCGLRKDITLVTKGGHPEFRNLNYSRLAPECIEYDINTSLAVLDVGQVDVYLLHRDDEHIPVCEIMDVLDQFVKDGLTRAIGASNWSTARILEANRYAETHGKTPFTVSQIQWNMAECRRDQLMDPTCLCMTPGEYKEYLKNKMPVMAYSAQAVGFFSKFLAGQQDKMSERTRVFLTPENISRAERVGKLCKKLGCTPAALCIAFITCNSVDGYAVIGNSSMKQMEESLEAVELRIDKETIEWIMG